MSDDENQAALAFTSAMSFNYNSTLTLTSSGGSGSVAELTVNLPDGTRKYVWLEGAWKLLYGEAPYEKGWNSALGHAYMAIRAKAFNGDFKVLSLTDDSLVSAMEIVKNLMGAPAQPKED